MWFVVAFSRRNDVPVNKGPICNDVVGFRLIFLVHQIADWVWDQRSRSARKSSTRFVNTPVLAPNAEEKNEEVKAMKQMLRLVGTLGHTRWDTQAMAEGELAAVAAQNGVVRGKTFRSVPSGT